MSSAAPSVAIRFWNKIRNSGDSISAPLINRLFGAAPFQAEASKPHLLAVGSILFMANRFSIIWGSGVINKVAYLPQVEPHQIRALRGKLSADYMIKQGIPLGDIAFGDPGIFANILVDDSYGGSAPPRYRVAVVPHHNSMQHPFFKAIEGREDVCVVSMLDDSLKPVELISQSEIVISQSLHGLVYAESLGKPALWISSVSDDVWNFKFDDWFSTTENPQLKPAMMDLPLDSLIAKAERRMSTIRRQDLIDQFPNELLLKNANNRLDYLACRKYSPALVFFRREHQATLNFDYARDMPVLSVLSNRLVEVTRTLFRCWSERPYCIAADVGTRVFPSPDQSDVIIAALDERASADFAFLVEKLPVLPDGVSTILLSHGVVMYCGYKAIGVMVYLRPDFDKLTDNFIVFGI